MSVPVAAVIFDLDGTLMDHASAARAGLRSWFDTLGVSLTADLTAAWFSAEERHFASWRSGEIDFAEQRRRRVRDVLPLVGISTGDDAWCDTAFEGYRTAYQRGWTAFPDAAPAVEQVRSRGLSTAVLTNGAEVQQQAKVDAIDLRAQLGPVFTAEALGTPKPDPRAYLQVCTALGVDPARVLHVGDSFDLDVRAPRRAGLQAVFLDRPGEGPADETKIRSLVELTRRL